MLAYFRHFGFAGTISVLAFALVLAYLGPSALLIMLILVAIEITFSFDNAIVNAKILVHLSPLWQKLFLSIGIVVAIFGMRLVFPIGIVALTAHLPWHDVVNLALHHPEAYAAKLELANPTISAFGGAFLLMLALHFFMDEKKTLHWVKGVERPLQRFSYWWLPAGITVCALIVLALLPQNHHAGQTIRAGLIGLTSYAAVHGVTWLINRKAVDSPKNVQYTGLAAFGMFMYLQVLDASFSFDGVLGAFAITNKVVLIAAGLGVGAVWVRSFTVFLVKKGTLSQYKYLEHGAYYAIAVLAMAMLLGELISIPDAVTGLTGLGLIVASIVASRQTLQRK